MQFQSKHQHIEPGTQTTAAAFNRLQKNLLDIYPEPRAKELLRKLLPLLTWQKRQARSWLTERDTVLIAYGDHLQHPGFSPLEALRKFSEAHFKSSFSTLHILPFYPYSSDDGYSVTDFKRVNPDFGNWHDIARLRHDFKLMFDLPLNHVSVSHQWFQRFLGGDPKYRKYFIELPKGTDVSKVIRPRTHPLLHEFQTVDGPKNVWTTFSADQADLNYDNPEVLLEMVDTLLFYVKKGAQAIRLDAVGFLWKRAAAASLHMPETHKLIEVLRSVLDIAAPNVLLVTETNVPHRENISYFGDGRHEAQLVYNFALSPLLIHAIHTGRTELLSEWAGALETPSERTAFFNFTASHDGIGLRPAEGILSRYQINRMIGRIQKPGGLVSYRTNPDDSIGPYELNISYFDAVAVPEDGTDIAIDKFMVTQAACLALAGIPAVYLSSLFGAGSWRTGVHKLGYNRAINREKYRLIDKQGTLTMPALAVSASRAARIMCRYRHLLRIRRMEAAFHPNAPQRILFLNPSVFAVQRIVTDGRSCLVALHNFSGSLQHCHLPVGAWQDCFTKKVYIETITLLPYQVCWLKSVI